MFRISDLRVGLLLLFRARFRVSWQTLAFSFELEIVGQSISGERLGAFATLELGLLNAGQRGLF
jgi:hypothetical protein